MPWLSCLKSHCRFANQVEGKFVVHLRLFIESIERRRVTSRHHGSTISGWQHNQRQRPVTEGERQKSNRFLLTKKQICMCIMLLCSFLCRCCTPATWNFLISHACFICQIKWNLNKIDVVCRSVNSFFKECFWFVVIQKFATMTTCSGKPEQGYRNAWQTLQARIWRELLDLRYKSWQCFKVGYLRVTIA